MPKFNIGLQIGDKVETTGRHVGSNIGVIKDIDLEWHKPYEVELSSGEILLFEEEALKPLKNDGEDLSTELKLMYIRENSSDSLVNIQKGNSRKSRIASIIDVKNGVNKLNLYCKDADELAEFIMMTKPHKIIIDLNDYTFFDTMVSVVNKSKCGFKIEKNGLVTYEN